MDNKLQPLIEAVLFSAREPISAERIAEELNLDKNRVLEEIDSLGEHYRREKHGLRVQEFSGGYLLSTSEELTGRLEKVLTRQRRVSLSEAARETLAIIAYFQPITRSEIEEIRGVSAEATLNTLQKHDLICEQGRRDSPGRPIEYGTTESFLYYFGISDLSRLPRREEVREKMFEPEEESDPTPEQQQEGS